MISFLLTVLCFVLTIPLKSVIFMLKHDVEKTEKKYNKDCNKKDDKGKLKKLFKRSRRSNLKSKDRRKLEKTNSEYRNKSRLLTALITVLNLMKGSTMILLIITILVILVMCIVIVLLFIVISSVVTLLADKDGFKMTLSNHINSSSSKNKDVDASEDAIDDWLKCVDDTWKYCRRSGYEYSQSYKKDSKYGYVRLDCSGFVYMCMQKAGYYKMPAKSPSSFCTSDMKSSISRLKNWKVVSYKSEKDLKKGDILCIPGSHANIYAGNKKWYNNGTVGSSFQEYEGTRDTGYHTYWVKELNKASVAYIFRLKGTKGVTGKSITGLTYPQKGGNTKVPWYCQGDYGNVMLASGKSIASSGCGYTSAAMVLTYCSGKKITPKGVFDKIGSKYYVYNQGTSSEQLTANLFKDFGLGDKWEFSANLKGNETKCKQYGKEGCIFIASVKTCKFTSAYHYIVVRGIDSDGNCWVNDPNGRSSAARNGTDAKTWLNKKFNFHNDVFVNINSGIWAVKPK